MLTVDFRRPTNPFATRYTAPGARPYRWIDPVDGEIRSSERDSLDWLVQRISDNPCSAIVGPHGSGKSSLLAALQAPLRRRWPVVHRLCLEPPRTSRLLPKSGSIGPRSPAAEESSGLRAIPATLVASTSAARQVTATVRAIGRSHAGELWLIDGLERLGPAGLRLVTLTARARGISLLATVHRRWSFLPVVWVTELNATLAKRLTLDRLDDWPEEYADLLLESWDDRWRRAAGNLRELWFQLFDEFEILNRTAYASQASLPP